MCVCACAGACVAFIHCSECLVHMLTTSRMGQGRIMHPHGQFMCGVAGSSWLGRQELK